jgi:hypothetical protein
MYPACCEGITGKKGGEKDYYTDNEKKRLLTSQVKFPPNHSIFFLIIVKITGCGG